MNVIVVDEFIHPYGGMEVSVRICICQHTTLDVLLLLHRVVCAQGPARRHLATLKRLVYRPNTDASHVRTVHSPACLISVGQRLLMGCNCWHYRKYRAIPTQHNPLQVNAGQLPLVTYLWYGGFMVLRAVQVLNSSIMCSTPQPLTPLVKTQP